jgi:hypothetical protein
MSADWGAARWDESPDDIAPPLALAANDESSGEADLPALAEQANRYHNRAQELTSGALEVAWLAGHALLDAKRQCRHGEWLGWLADNFEGSERTAQAYIRLASNTQHVADLDCEQSLRDALNALCKPRPPKPEPESEDTPEPEPEDTKETPLPIDRPIDTDDTDDTSVSYLVATLRVIDRSAATVIETAQTVTDFESDSMTQVLTVIAAIRLKLDTIEHLAKGISDDDVNHLLGPMT